MGKYSKYRSGKQMTRADKNIPLSPWARRRLRSLVMLLVVICSIAIADIVYFGNGRINSIETYKQHWQERVIRVTDFSPLIALENYFDINLDFISDFIPDEDIDISKDEGTYNNDNDGEAKAPVIPEFVQNILTYSEELFEEHNQSYHQLVKEVAPHNLRSSLFKALVIDDNTAFFTKPSVFGKTMGYLPSGYQLIVSDIKDGWVYTHKPVGWIKTSKIIIDK